MNKYILLLVLISGVLSGYLIGDYRGKNARETLKEALETGKTLDTERETTIARLKTELDSLNDKHRQELAAIRKHNDAKLAEWRRVKDGLNNKIKYSNAKLAASDNRLINLTSRRDAATGDERAKLDLEITALRKARNDLRQEIEGDACLKTRVPHSVFEALNETNTAGNK
jgi:chromosome segregation ATPase